MISGATIASLSEVQHILYSLEMYDEHSYYR